MVKVKNLQRVQPPKRKFGIIRNSRKERIVGVVAPSYGSEKLSYGLEVPGYSYKKVVRIPFHRFEKKRTFWRYSAFIVDNSVNLIHTNNHLPFSLQPFVISFENELPRYLGDIKNWMLKVGVERLLSQKCKKILGMSTVAVKLAKESFNEMGYPEIINKIDVFRGGVSLSNSSDLPIIKEKKSPIKLLFVGRAGFAKGLIPTLSAVEEARKKGINVELTIVSSLEGGQYVLKEHYPSVNEWKRKIFSNPYLKWYQALPNETVRNIMRRHDLLVFPSLDETLGWVVIEAGMESLPSVVSNVFALPELVDHEITGSIIKLELGKLHRWRGIWLKGEKLKYEIEKANLIIHNHILSLLEKVSLNRNILEEWGKRANKKLEEMYNPKNAGFILSKIYDNALG